MSFLEELKRRNVVRVGVAYAVGSWVLLQIFDVVGEILELPIWGGKLILAVLVAGFFITLFVAWTFELTPEGLKRDAEVDRSQSSVRRANNKLNVAIIVFLALAVVLLLADKFAGSGVGQARNGPLVSPTNGQEISQESHKSLAVLPFENRSPAKGT